MVITGRWGTGDGSVRRSRTVWRSRGFTGRPGAVVVTGLCAFILAACGTALGASTPTTAVPVSTAPSLSGGLPPATLPLAPSASLPAPSVTSDPEPTSDPGSDPGSDPVGVGDETDPPLSSSAPASSPLPAFYNVSLPLPPGPPGSVIRSQVIEGGSPLPTGATAYRVLFRSESDSGGDVPESGVVVVPGGPAPPGGFPIVSWAHGTTGLADGCAPSLTGVGTIPYLDDLLRRRMVVVATDYQGLGAPGVPPYLVGQSEAQGVLDVARAARALLGDSASNTVAAFGYSQGGQAALFAGQIAQSYAPELFVAAVVAVGPVASLTELAPVDPGPTPDPDSGFAVSALYAWSATYGAPSLGSVLTPAALALTPVVASGCSGAVSAAYDAIPTDRLLRPGWSNVPSLRAEITANQPGQAPVSAPVLVVQGTDDTLVPTAVTTRLVETVLCRGQHDSVRYVQISGAGHAGALADGESVVVPWIAGRLDRLPAPSTCSRSGVPGG